ncbi:hypothetical protein [Streptomyces sp. NRRL F-5755]|uniref:hypothetical protein n=1 Tax=Streptomyces sp. NRRL F-5755 TaxID=1519475 RepID=UPI00133158E9|nr:hypothetical protein [Streptomyces sp. NRRL F-5755]
MRDGEEHPGPMRPGDTRCSVLDGATAVATRTYDEQRDHQALERRRNAGNGAVLMLYGAAGTLVAWRATRPRPMPDADREQGRRPVRRCTGTTDT